MIRNSFIQTTTFLLILLWIYAAISKLAAFGHFQMQMHNQTLPLSVQWVLIYMLPPLEMAVAVLLVFSRTMVTGLYFSSVLLGLFSCYIALVIFHFFNRTPCSCGGILEKIGWVPHLFFNLFFLIITLTAIFIFQRKEAIKH